MDVVDQLLEANADPELKICGKSTVKIEWTYCEVHLGNTLDLNHPLGMFTSNTQDNSGVNPEGAHKFILSIMSNQLLCALYNTAA